MGSRTGSLITGNSQRESVNKETLPTNEPATSSGDNIANSI